VVVESVDALLAEIAVSRPGGADKATVWAQAHWIQSVEQGDEVHLVVFLEVAWITAHYNSAQKNRSPEKALNRPR